jgi:hypothetical protein
MEASGNLDDRLTFRNQLQRGLAGGLEHGLQSPIGDIAARDP